MIEKQSWYKGGEDKNKLAKKELVDELENFERNFFRNRDKPTKPSQKCDACRAIAYELDAEFEDGEAQMGITPIYNYNLGNCKLQLIFGISYEANPTIIIFQVHLCATLNEYFMLYL
jgi:hypothetical protein